MGEKREQKNVKKPKSSTKSKKAENLPPHLKQRPK